MAQTSDTDFSTSDIPLPQAFREAQALFDQIENSELESGDAAFQEQCRELLLRTRTAAHLVNALSIFSPNEELEDINTGDLKYLLVPYYHGAGLMKLADRDSRMHNLQIGGRLMQGFLTDLERIQLLKKADEFRDWQEGEPTDPGARRTQKIARLKAKKAASKLMQEKAAQLAAASKRTDAMEDDAGDMEEVERDYVLLLLKCCAFQALEEMNLVRQEIEMLEQVEKMKRENGGELPEPEEPTPRPYKPPITILPADVNRAAMETYQRQMHTGRIPGMYTITLDQWQAEEAARIMAEQDEKRLRERSVRPVRVGEDEHEDEEDAKARQKEEEADSDAAVKKARDWDDFKDENRRGSGNRKNKG